MSSLTPMQQAIFMNHQISIQTYLTQLSTAISLLPLSVDTGSIPLLGADAFVALEANLLHRESWAHVLPLLETVWGRPGAVSPGHITKGLQGIEVVSQLFGHVGAATLAGLEDEERDGAIGWIRAIRDAVREKCTSPKLGTFVTAEAPSPPGGINAGPSSWAPPPPKGDVIAPPPKSKGKARARAKPAAAAPRAPAPPKHALPTASTSTSSNKKLKLTAPLSPASSLSSLSDLDDSDAGAAPRKPSSSSLSASLAPSGSTSASTSDPPRSRLTLTLSHSSTPALPPVLPPSKSTINATKPKPPPKAPRVSATDRPQRSRKAPAHLDLTSPARGSNDAEGPQFEHGEAVLARFPNYSWWPSVIVDPEDAPDDGSVQGVRTEGSYMVKAIPTGGDWRWNPPSHIRTLPASEIEAILSGTQRGPDPQGDNLPPPAWSKYRADLVEGLLIAQDKDRLEEWAGKETPLEVYLAQEKIRKKEARARALHFPPEIVLEILTESSDSILQSEGGAARNKALATYSRVCHVWRGCALQVKVAHVVLDWTLKNYEKMQRMLEETPELAEMVQTFTVFLQPTAYDENEWSEMVWAEVDEQFGRLPLYPGWKYNRNPGWNQDRYVGWYAYDYDEIQDSDSESFVVQRLHSKEEAFEQTFRDQIEQDMIISKDMGWCRDHECDGIDALLAFLPTLSNLKALHIAEKLKHEHIEDALDAISKFLGGLKSVTIAGERFTTSWRRAWRPYLTPRD
ncbi:hypothetical protein RQP46_002221 [Phenoliferia psychrophenolica]